MRHLGDIKNIKGSEVPLVDIVCGGSPCQDLSIAGARAGLIDGERSSLFMEQIRIIKEMHDECRRTNQPIRPRYMLFENFLGLFSSNDGEDFRRVLEETARIVSSDTSIPRLPTSESWSNAGCILGDGWSLSWRVSNAEFWGTPQRRRRISLVADFRGETAPEILFERESLSGNTQAVGETGTGSAPGLEGCVGETDSKAISFLERAGCSGGGKGILIQEERTGTLGTVAIQNVFCIGNGQADRTERMTPELADALNCMHDQQIVCYSQDAYDKLTPTETSAALRASGGNNGGGERDHNSQVVGSLCSRDYKGVGDQYVREGKLIVQDI